MEAKYANSSTSKGLKQANDITNLRLRLSPFWHDFIKYVPLMLLEGGNISGNVFRPLEDLFAITWGKAWSIRRRIRGMLWHVKKGHFAASANQYHHHHHHQDHQDHQEHQEHQEQQQQQQQQEQEEQNQQHHHQEGGQGWEYHFLVKL